VWLSAYAGSNIRVAPLSTRNPVRKSCLPQNLFASKNVHEMGVAPNPFRKSVYEGRIASFPNLQEKNGKEK